MTAIVGVLNSQGIAIAADSAVTVSGANGKKVYNRSNKIFTLSKYHPVGIAIYSSADYLGIPLETLIKLYRKTLRDTSFQTLEEYKMNFLDFVKTQIPNVSTTMKERALFSVVNENYTTLIARFKAKLSDIEPQIAALDPAAATALLTAEISAVIAAYQLQLNAIDKAEYIDKTFEEFAEFYADQFPKITDYILSTVRQERPEMILDPTHLDAIHRLLFSVINIEHIFERYCGLVFIGFGEAEIYPSSQVVLLGAAICDTPRFLVLDPVKIIPGEQDSNILPYVQGDVTTTVLTGVDPSYKETVTDSITEALNTISEQLEVTLNNPLQSGPMIAVIQNTARELIDKLAAYQFNTLTGPLLEILTHMGKEDMSELAESLVNITSLKRKFTSSDSSDESVGGPVDVAIITKGDGFIWMKRKQYFDIANNKNFYDKYYK